MRARFRGAAPLLVGLVLVGLILIIRHVVAGRLPAGVIAGRITDGHRGIPGVRVYPDRLPRIAPALDPPVATTDAKGRFRIALDSADTVLAVEKDGWHRDLVPAAEWGKDIVLTPEPRHHVEAALIVRLDFADEASRVPDSALRQLLFSRRPGVASAANYLYEVSKGALSLEEGRMLHLQTSVFPAPRTDAQKSDMVRWVLDHIHGQDLGACDHVNNRTGAPGADGKPDHLWIITPGKPQSLTADEKDLKAVSLLMPLPWDKYDRWPVVFLTEEVPLGNIVHEAFHSMGEQSVDDLYLGCDDPATAGIWDLMDAGQYRGWDRSHPEQGPWVDDTGYSPSHPLAWVRSELWYRGWYRETMPRLDVTGTSWEGWIAPASRAPQAGAQPDPQWVTLPDPRRQGPFWSLEVRRPWGFERGRVGNRFGPGYAGLVVAHIDPSLLSPDVPKGAVRVVDAHPGTPEPPKPRFPCGRWELDDAAFNLGPGENPRGQSGPLSWEVIETDASGRMKVHVNLRKPPAKKRVRKGK